MEALISGRNGVALVVDGDHLASIHVDEPDRMVPRHPGEIHFLTGERGDFFPVEGVSRGEIVRQLTLAHARERSLTLTLILIDPDLSDGLRLKVAKRVEDLIKEERVLVFLESVLYAEPLPTQADLHGALRLAREAGTSIVQNMLERFWKRQDTIAAVREAWNAMPSATFDGERKRWQAVAVREGLFRSLVLLHEAGGDVNELVSTASKTLAVRSLPNFHAVLRSWISPLLQFSEQKQTHPGRVVALDPGLVAEPKDEYKEPPEKD